MDVIAVGKRIMSLREEKNYTRVEFAEVLDISSKFLYEIEYGRKGFSVEVLYRISKSLSVSCDYILTGKDTVSELPESAKLDL